MIAPSWSDVIVAIPTVASRRSIFEALTRQLSIACHEALVVTNEHIEGEPPRNDFPRLLANASTLGRPWVLQLEDDVVLAPMFRVEALAPWCTDADVITIFSRSRKDLTVLASGEKWRRQPPSAFSMAQGFFIRSELASGIDEFAPGWYASHPQHQHAADLLLGAYLSTKRARVVVRVPSLVQHRRGPSTLPGHRGARQSESYRRVFGEIE